MRIAILAWESLYSLRSGGMSPAVTGLAEALAKQNEVHFFTRKGEGQRDYEVINNVHYHRCNFDAGFNMLHYCHNMSMAMLSRLYEVEKKFGKFDLVHGHDWHVVDALHELKNKRPLVLTFHSTEFGRNGGEFGSWWEYKEISGKEWYGGYVAERITAVSHTIKNELMWLYQIPAQKIDVVPNGFDPSKYKMNIDAGRVKEKYGIAPLSPVIFFIGRMVKQKAPELLVEAVPHVLRHRSDAVFIMAGGGDMRGYLEHLAWERGAAHAIKFLGYISDEERIRLLNACDIVAITSRNEPFGMVLLEAWAAEKAVVATDVGGLAENIENFKDGIKVFLYPESVAWGINYIINNATYVKELGKNGKAKLKNFSWEVVAEKMLHTYLNIIK